MGDETSVTSESGGPLGSNLLTLCPACGRQVSRGARSCPNCGHSIGARRAALRTVAISVATLLVLSAIGVVGAIGVGLVQNPFKETVAQVAASVEPSVVTVTATVFRGGTSSGSGFFYGKAGHVVTNAHVLAKAISVTITDASGQPFTADLEGIDRSGDFAELSTSDTAPKPLAGADQAVSVGDEVVVIGNPFGTLPNTVTHGLVAGTDRQFTIDATTYQNMIQSDAVANPGNSGGPMVNMSGKLVGMVTAGGSGYAYAIPWNAFGSEVTSWEASGNTVALGPPLIPGLAKSYVLGGIGSGWKGVTYQGWGSLGWHSAWTRPPNFTYGGGAVDIYLVVEPNLSVAQSDYQYYVTPAAEPGYTNIGALGGLGDESTGFQRIVSDQVSYLVVWRDRNGVGLIYLGSGITAAPDISLATTLGVAASQENPLAANLSGYQ
jgi:Trypsin-like peptidase domain/zinc-ribbon domain